MRRTGDRQFNQKRGIAFLALLEIIGRPFFRLAYGLFLLLRQIHLWLTHQFSQKRRIVLRSKKAKKEKASRPPRRALFNIRPPLPHFRFHPYRKTVIKSLGWGLIFLGLSFGFLHFWILKDLPDPDRLIDRNYLVSTKIYDRHGELLYKMFRTQNRTLVKIREIPNYLLQATVAIEDAEFYEHAGFSWRGILRSVIKNINEGKLQGGSTITQQLVKNALLSSEKTLVRKLKELVLSIRTEMRFSKEEILQMYLNEVGYGGTAYGAEEASWRYFGKSVRDLSLPEAALLAGLPASPTRYSPFGAHPELAKQRQAIVLSRMASEGFISRQEAQEAQTTELNFNYHPNHLRAPHFVMYVKDQLVEKYGEQVVEEGGLEVNTSLDLEIQTFVEKVLTEELNRITHLKITNGAVLVTKPETGEILAMVGSRDYFDLETDGNVNVTLQPRQPGSAIKPVTYALALQSGYTPATLIADTPITYQIPGQPPYAPVNYDGRFHGKITIRQALACSYNVPAVKILSSLGLPRFLEFAQTMGISTWTEPERYGLALTLGSAEIKMTDLAVVYGTFANLGRKTGLRPIREITDYRNRSYPELTTSAAPDETSLDPRIAYLINHILADNQARTPTFGSRSALVIPGHQVAVKTGTSNDLRDNWTIGYTPEFLVAVWVGNNDNTPMSQVASGVTGASPIFNKIMTGLLGTGNSRNWSVPPGLVRKSVCLPTGTLACPGCATEEYFLEENQFNLPCSIRSSEPREIISSARTFTPFGESQSALPVASPKPQNRPKKSPPTSRQ